MDKNDYTQYEVDWLTNIKFLFNTETGKSVIEGLVEYYVDPSSMRADPYNTAYLLGQKELIQELVRIKDSDDIAEHIKMQA